MIPPCGLDKPVRFSNSWPKASPTRTRPTPACCARKPQCRPGRGAWGSPNMPGVKAALGAFSNAWPAALSFDELGGEVQRRLAPKSIAAGTANALAESLVHCYLSNVVALHVSPAQFALSA